MTISISDWNAYPPHHENQWLLGGEIVTDHKALTSGGCASLGRKSSFTVFDGRPDYTAEKPITCPKCHSEELIYSIMVNTMRCQDCKHHWTPDTMTISKWMEWE